MKNFPKICCSLALTLGLVWAPLPSTQAQENEPAISSIGNADQEKQMSELVGDGSENETGSSSEPAAPDGSEGTTGASAPSASNDLNLNSDESDPSAGGVVLNLGEVIDKCLEAYGGEEALSALSKNAQIYGKLIPPNGAGQKVFYAYRKFRKGKRWRVDLEAPPAQAAGTPIKRVLAFNGLSGWRSVSNTVSDLNPVRLAQLNDDNECQPDLLTYWGKENQFKFTLLGKTTFRQVPVYSVLVTNKDDRDCTLFIDRRNYLIVGIKYETRGVSQENKRTVTVEYSQYRPSGGTMFPFKQTRYINGRLASELSISSVMLSESVSESLFDRPQSAGKIRLSNPVNVRFSFVQNEILVKARINGGEELTFLFDTGASDTIIDRRVAAEHFLAKQGKQKVTSLAGKVGVDMTSLKRFEMDKLILNDLEARITSLAYQSQQLGRPLAGIIGTNLIKKFVVRIDYGTSVITFYDQDTFKRPASADSVPFLQPNAPVVNITLDGRQKLPVLIDTGAAFNNLPRTVARKQLGSGAGQASYSTEGTGLDGSKLKLGSVVVGSVQFGRQVARKVNFTFFNEAPGSKSGASATSTSDGKVVEEKGGFFKSDSIGILGNPFLKNYVLIMDYKFQRLLLASNPVVKIKEQITRALITGDDKLVIHRDYRAAEDSYQKALLVATSNKDVRSQAILWGRLGNLRRMMAKDLSRPEHTKSSYEYFIKAQNLALECGASDVRGRILADWSLLYSDHGQVVESGQTINQALLLAPQDPQVNVDYAIHLYRAGRLAEMQKYIEKALFAEPSNWQALWYQYKLADKFMNYPRALSTLKEIKKYYPWSKLAGKKMLEIQQKIKMVPQGN